MNNNDQLTERLERIERTLGQLLTQRLVKDWYTTAEAAALLGKAEFTVREYCRLGRVHATKRQCGRGASREWIIAHVELERIRNEGLLPDVNRYLHSPRRVVPRHGRPSP